MTPLIVLVGLFGVSLLCGLSFWFGTRVQMKIDEEAFKRALEENIIPDFIDAAAAARRETIGAPKQPRTKQQDWN